MWFVSILPTYHPTYQTKPTFTFCKLGLFRYVLVWHPGLYIFVLFQQLFCFCPDTHNYITESVIFLSCLSSPGWRGDILYIHTMLFSPIALWQMLMKSSLMNGGDLLNVLSYWSAATLPLRHLYSTYKEVFSFFNCLANSGLKPTQAIQKHSLLSDSIKYIQSPWTKVVMDIE